MPPKSERFSKFDVVEVPVDDPQALATLAERMEARPVLLSIAEIEEARDFMRKNPALFRNRKTKH